MTDSFGKMFNTLESQLKGMGGNEAVQGMLNEAKKLHEVAEKTQSSNDKKYHVVVHKPMRFGLSIEKKPTVWTRSKLETYTSMEINDSSIVLENSTESVAIDYNKDIIEYFS